jgi:hypothetical protein
LADVVVRQPVTAQSTSIDKPELLSFKEGYVKIRLSYLTYEPKHLRSITLMKHCGVKPPFQEHIYILVPCSKVFAKLETFVPMFDWFQRHKILPLSSRLQDFKILDEDNLTLSYIF